MLYEWHELTGLAVKWSFHGAANALALSGGLMDVFRLKASGVLSSARVFADMAHDHPAPVFGLGETTIDGSRVLVREDILIEKPFCNLVRFSCQTAKPRNVPKVLLVAPISGHRPTLLRDTVRDLIPHADVYITDWKDAREVPLSQGRFSLEDYIDHVQNFLRHIGPETHIVGISQSTVPVLAAASLMAARNEWCRPLSMTLMCGPIDPRINETEISRLSRERDIGWFENNLIHTVPFRYPGRGRRVFPGFLQEVGMVMNTPGKNHPPFNAVNKLYRGQGDKLDADAPYYLDTIRQVFLEHHLPRGIMTWRGETVDPSKITDTALMVVEGSEDNITAPGQTKAAHDLCTGLDPSLRGYHLQHGAGHYDLFAGPHWEGKILSKINVFWRKIAAIQGIAYDPPQTESPVRAARIPDARLTLAA
jgi:poly(3-hydroxybutyrate) depolymerase